MTLRRQITGEMRLDRVTVFHLANEHDPQEMQEEEEEMKNRRPIKIPHFVALQAESAPD